MSEFQIVAVQRTAAEQQAVAIVTRYNFAATKRLVFVALGGVYTADALRNIGVGVAFVVTVGRGEFGGGWWRLGEVASFQLVAQPIVVVTHEGMADGLHMHANLVHTPRVKAATHQAEMLEAFDNPDF